MIAGAQLVAALARDAILMTASAICRSACPACSPATGRPGPTRGGRRRGFIVGRATASVGPRDRAQGGGILRVPALGYSAAELQHGPRASITPATPVLVLRQNDEAATAIDDFVCDLHGSGGTAFTAGGATGTLPWIGDGHPVCDPVLMLIPAYRAIEAAARRRGFDPDHPPHLRKVTRTL